MTPDNNPAQRFEARAREYFTMLVDKKPRFDESVALLSAEFAAIDREAREWRTIDSAPKDGTWFLAICWHYHDVIPAVAHWETFPRVMLYAPQSQWRTDDAGDYESDESWEEDWVCVRYEPTHWMPLPSPPETEGKV